jgi:hypothetical protein
MSIRVAGLLTLVLALTACGASVPAPSRIALVSRLANGATTVTAINGSGGRSIGRPVQALLAPSGASVATLQGGGGNSPVDLTTYTTSGKRHQHVVAQFGLPQYSRSGIQLLAWSADSTLIALTAVKLSTAGSEEELLVVNTGSGAVSTIAAGNIVGASFSPGLPDRIAFAASTVSQLDNGKVNIYTANADGSGRHAIVTSSLNTDPLWSSAGIIFARLAQLGNANVSPLYQLWLVQPAGGAPRKLTSIVAGPLASGLPSPLSISAAGTRLVADFDSPYSSVGAIDVWTVDLSGSRATARRIAIPGTALTADGISRSGKLLLIDALDMRNNHVALETVPFGGGKPHVLAAHAVSASWNA